MALSTAKLCLKSFPNGEEKLKDTVSYEAQMLNKNNVMWHLILDVLAILENTLNVYASQLCYQ